jgi:hypothetical protein
VDQSAAQANASASTGSGSALGIVTWDSISIQETCLPDGTVSDQIDCSTYESITNLYINGQPATAAGNFSSGASIPFSGNIPDTDCPLGTDSFSGNLVLDNSILNSGTEQGSDTEVGMEITGTATCYTADLIPIYTTNIDDQIAGPKVWYESEEPKFIREMIVPKSVAYPAF